MNTPPTRRRYRFPGPRGDMPSGKYTSGLSSPKHAIRLAAIVSKFVHLENHMSNVAALLLGTEHAHSAGVMMRAIKAPKTRIDILRDLLQKSRDNYSQTSEIDAIIAAFSSCNTGRNKYIHGLWYTNDKQNRAYLSEMDEGTSAFFRARSVSLTEMNALLSDITALSRKAYRL